MSDPRHRLTIAAVLFILGLLVVVQVRAQAGGSGLAALSTQDLTVLVANLNSRNDQLRTEVAALERNLTVLADGSARGETSIGQLRADLARVRIYSGLDPVGGPGVTITVGGAIDGEGVEDLLNELRNSGAEAIAVGDVRVVPGTVVAGSIGSLSVEGVALPAPFEIRAIGSPETLTGSLTRVGGIVAQLATTYPGAMVTVTPVERLELPATTRLLVPTHGTPRL
jgi:uncharacterized protein YlxW (UPF0749 family)